MLLKSRGRAAFVVAVVLSAPAFSASASVARAASSSASRVDPDTYACPIAVDGFVGFEDLADGTPLGSGRVPGMEFTTATGASWSVGDFATGAYNGKYPAGSFTSEQTHFATAPIGSGLPRIRFSGGRASTVSVLVARDAAVTLQARNASNLVIESTPPVTRPNGRHMILMQITRPSADIASVTLKGGTGFFSLDSICTDAPNVPTGQLQLTTVDGPPGTLSVVNGSGFGAAETVDITLAGKFLVSTTTNPDGTFTRPLPISPSAPPGPQQVVANGRTSGTQATATFLVHTDWDQFGFDAAHTGFNPLEKTLTAANIAGLHPVWTAQVGLQATSAAVAEGVVYVDSFDAAAYAFKESAPGPDSDQVWSRVTGAPIHAPPVVDGDLAFIASQDGFVYALTASADPTATAPTTVWSYAANQPIGRTPVVDHGRLYFTSNKGDVYALKETTGHAVWHSKLPTTIRSDLALDATHIYVGADDGNLYVLNRSDGTVAKTLPLGGGAVLSDPTVSEANQAVFVGSASGKLWAFSTATLSLLWSKSTPFPLNSSPTVAGNLVYVTTGDPHNGILEARSVTNGKLSWSVATGSFFNSKPVVANGVVYVGSVGGTLFAYDARLGGNPLFSEAFGSALSEVTVTNGSVCVPLHDGRLIRLTL